MATIRFHSKVLQTPNVPIDTMVAAMNRVYNPHGISVQEVTRTNLQLPNQSAYLDIDVGSCVGGAWSAEQSGLFSDGTCNWSGWVWQGAPPGGIVGAPATVSRNPAVCNVYARGTDNALWQKAYTAGQGWGGWSRHGDGGQIISAPAVGSMNKDHEHVFGRGLDDNVWQKFWQAGKGWSGWFNLGRPPVGFIGGPAIISRNGTVCNIYVRGGDNALWQKAWYDNKWHDWSRHNDGGVITSTPTLGSMGPDHEHVFARGLDGNVWQKYWTKAGGWKGWFNLGAPPGMIDGPATVSRNGSVCNLYARGGDNGLWARSYWNNHWGNWDKFHDDGVLSERPAPGSMNGDHEHVFVRGTDGAVYQRWWLGSTRKTDLVAFFVRSTVPSYNGCAAYPANFPGIVAASYCSQWTLAHELGHTLGLPHLATTCPKDGGPTPTQLMTGCGTSLITVDPPSLGNGEVTTVKNSPLIK